MTEPESDAVMEMLGTCENPVGSEGRCHPSDSTPIIHFEPAHNAEEIGWLPVHTFELHPKARRTGNGDFQPGCCDHHTASQLSVLGGPGHHWHRR